MPQSFPFKLSHANTKAPWNPFLPANNPLAGDPHDPAIYVMNPGVNFYRPWLASSDKFNGTAFIWPLGIEGFDLTIDPQIGVHRLIGDNAVEVDVTHKGEERFVMSGNLPGFTGPDNMRALRQVVYMTTPKGGKVLYVPHILPYAQRVVVARARFSHAEDMRGQDMTYEIEFVRTGLIDAGQSDNEPQITEPIPPDTAAHKASARSVKVDDKHNSLRKIAKWKLGNASKWNVLYKKNEAWFLKRKIITAKIPDYRLPNGTVIYF
jgi:hypothetical protein